VESINNSLPDPIFWSNQKVLITGHTGFKGQWLTNWLSKMGAKVAGLSYSNYPKTFLGENSLDGSPYDFDFDICSEDWQGRIENFEPTVIFHLAAQALVSTGFRNPSDTYRTNVFGTMQVLNFFHKSTSAKTLIVITTDKVYKNKDAHLPKNEEDLLGGNDPYSASKGALELMVGGWPLREDQQISTVRSGNVIGGGDLSAHRLIPDLLRAWQSGRTIDLRNPSGIRPWLHVLEPIRGYIVLAERLAQMNSPLGPVNFAPRYEDHVPVLAIAQAAIRNFPFKSGFDIKLSSTLTFPETEYLFLNSTKAKKFLNWEPVWNWEKSVQVTVDWYLEFEKIGDSRELIEKDINLYVHEILK